MCGITQAELKSILSYNPETGIFVWLVGQAAGYEAGWNSHGYLETQINGKYYSLHRLAWFYVYGKFPAVYIDHINGNKADNRIINLRECSPLETSWNAGVFRSNTSGFKGVSWCKVMGKWRAQIMVNTKQTRLGHFDTAELASAAYIAKAKELHGEFYNTEKAKLNQLNLSQESK